MVEADQDRIMCSEHPYARAEIYCQENQCRKMVCPMCIKKDGPHDGHKWKYIYEIGEEIKNEIFEEIKLTPEQFGEGAQVINQSILNARQYYNDLQARIQHLIQEKLAKLTELEHDIENYTQNNTDERKRELSALIDRSTQIFNTPRLFQIVQEKEKEHDVLVNISQHLYYKSKIENKLERITEMMSNVINLLENHEELKDLLKKNRHLAYFANKQVRVYNVDSKLAKSIDVDITKDNPEMIEVNDSIYIVGDLNYTLSTYEVDIDTGAVQKKADLIYKKYYTHLIHRRGFIYSLGGFDGASKNICEKYNIESNEWTQIPSLNSAKYVVGGCVFNDRYIYIFGGAGAHYQAYLEEIELLDCEEEEEGWKKVTIVNKEGWSPRYYIQAIQVDNRNILLFGGYNGADIKDSFLFDVPKREFKKLPDLKEATRFTYNRTSSAVLVEGKVFAVDYNNRIHTYDLAKNIWDMINFP